MENTTPNKKGGKGRATQSRGRDEEGKKFLKGFFKIADFLEGEREKNECKASRADGTTLTARTKNCQHVLVHVLLTINVLQQ